MNEEHPNQIIIDIPEKQLLEWLRNRNKVPTNWNSQLKRLREQLKFTFDEHLPANFSDKYASAADISYFDVLSILDFLRSCGKTLARDLFGRAKDSRLRAWEEVLQLYEKNNVFLVEAAQRLSQWATLDVPFLRKTIAKQQTVIASISKRQVDLEKSLDEAWKECHTYFESLGLRVNDDIDVQVEQLKRELPGLLSKIVDFLKRDEFGAVIVYHDKFVHLRASEDVSSKYFVALRQCRDCNSELLYQKREGHDEGSDSQLFSPEKLTIFPTALDKQDDACEESLAIDWGDCEIEERQDPVIVEKILDFNEQGELQPLVSMRDDKKEDDLEYSLMNKFFREAVESNLIELDAFFQQRIIEKEQLHNSVLFPVIEEEEEEPKCSLEECKRLAKQVKEAIALFHEPLISHILLLSLSQRFEQRLKLSLWEKLQRVHKIKSNISHCLQQKQEASKALADAECQYQGVIDRMLKIRNLLEHVLSSQFPECSIRIVGDISLLEKKDKSQV